MRTSSKSLVLVMLLTSFCQFQRVAAGEIGLEISPQRLRLRAGPQTWRFDQEGGRWSLAGIEVKGRVVARPLARSDAFWIGAGEASSYDILTDSPSEKAVRFSLGPGSAIYRARSGDALPVVHLEFDRTNETRCVFCCGTSAIREHGAWVTRGWVATDADNSEEFIDASNPWVFGHSAVGDLDVAYAFLPEVCGHIQRNGRTEQRTGTFFKAERRSEDDRGFRAVWRSAACGGCWVPTPNRSPARSGDSSARGWSSASTAATGP